MRILFLLICLVTLNFCFSQTDSLHVSRFLPAKYGVYPYKAEFYHSDLSTIINTFPYIQNEFGQIVENQNFVDSLKKNQIKNIDFLSDVNLSIENINQNFFQNEIPLFIDTIPNGVYVRYYEDYLYIEGDTIKFHKNRIATIFSVKDNVADGMAYWFSIDNQICYQKGNYIEGRKDGSWKYYDKTKDGQKQIVVSQKYYLGLPSESIYDTTFVKYVYQDNTGKHVVSYKECGIQDYFQLVFDDIPLILKNDTIIEIYNWRIKPEEKSFKASLTNRVLVEKFQLGEHVHIDNSDYLNRFNDFFYKWRESYGWILAHEFFRKRSVFSYFLNDFVIIRDRYTSQDLSPKNLFNYTFYESNYLNGNPFVRYNNQNEKESLTIYNENNSIQFQMKRIDETELLKLSQIHFDSIQGEDCLHYHEVEFDTNGKIKSSIVYSYLRDSVTNRPLSYEQFDQNGFYNGERFYSVVCKTDLLFPYHVLVDQIQFEKIENEENENKKLKYQYTNFFLDYHSEVKDTFELFRAKYDYENQFITEKIFVNFYRKEIKLVQSISPKMNKEVYFNYNKGVVKWNLSLHEGEEFKFQIDTVVTIIDSLRKIPFDWSWSDIDFNILFVRDPLNGLGLFVDNLKFNLNTSIYYDKSVDYNVNSLFYSNSKILNGKLVYNLTNELVDLFDVNGRRVSQFDHKDIFQIRIFNKIIVQETRFNSLSDSFKLLKFEIEIRNGVFDGQFRLFDQNNTIFKSFLIKNNRIEGSVSTYDYSSKTYSNDLKYINGEPDGLLISDFGKRKTNFKQGNKDGLETTIVFNNFVDSTYYENDVKNGMSIEHISNYFDPYMYKKVSNYTDNKLEGKQYFIRLDGKKDTLAIQYFKNGLLEGENIIFPILGDMRYYDKITCKKGICHGEVKRYNRLTNTIIFKGNYKNGLLDGLAIYYYPDKNLVFAKIVFKNGKIKSPLLFYDSTSNLIAKHVVKKDRFYKEINYQKGKIISVLKVIHNNTFDCDDKKKHPMYNDSYFLSNIKLESNSDCYINIFHFPYNQCNENEITFSYKLMKSNFTENGFYRFYNRSSSSYEILEKEKNSYVNLQKMGNWKYTTNNSYPYTINYSPNTLKLCRNIDTIKFSPTKKITQFANKRKSKVLWEKYVIENTSLYNCGDNETYDINTYYVAYEKDSSMHLRNGYQKNYYPNGVIQSEGMNKQGLPHGGWKFYNDNGSLREIGNYNYGIRVGRWLAGDLSKINYLGDICLDMNNPKNVALQKELENQLDIEEAFYENGSVVSSNSLRVIR